jgi:hypothetical protein
MALFGTILSDHRQAFSAVDVLGMLAHLLANIEYRDRRRIAAFMRHRRRKLFKDPFVVFYIWPKFGTRYSKVSDANMKTDCHGGWDGRSEDHFNFETLRYFTEHTTIEGEDFVHNFCSQFWPQILKSLVQVTLLA